MKKKAKNVKNVIFVNFFENKLFWKIFPITINQGIMVKIQSFS